MDTDTVLVKEYYTAKDVSDMLTIPLRHIRYIAQLLNIKKDTTNIYLFTSDHVKQILAIWKQRK